MYVSYTSRHSKTTPKIKKSKKKVRLSDLKFIGKVCQISPTFLPVCNLSEIGKVKYILLVWDISFIDIIEVKITN